MAQRRTTVIRRWPLVGALLATLALAGGASAADQGCVLSADPVEGPRGTTFTIAGLGFGEPTLVTILFSKEEVSPLEPRTVAELEVDNDIEGGFTLDLTPEDIDEAGFWTVRAVVPETECGDDVVVHVFGAPNTATAAAVDPGEASAAVPLMLVFGGLGALSVGLVGRRRAARARH